MEVDGRREVAIRLAEDGAVEIVDQTRLPRAFEKRRLRTAAEIAEAIRTMQVRGAPLIGVAGAFGVALALREAGSDAALTEACERLCETRPTAVNLRRRVEQVREAVWPLPIASRASRALALARAIAEEEIDICRRIGEHGLGLLREAHRRLARPVKVLTHCNAGWLATVDWGTALAPIFLAHREGLPVHVWVDETRPRNQGYLTAWELAAAGVPHTVIVDNAGGHLMQHGEVDLCIVGTDRTTATGDVCNKIGTYLKALAARDNGVPFYVAAPESSIDWSLRDGLREIPIEQRSAEEIHLVHGADEEGRETRVRVSPPGTQVANFGFDVTPARLVSGLITERGICAASAEGLFGLFPERRK